MSMMNANAAATTAMTANEPLDFELPEMGDSDFSNEELAEDMDGLTMSFPRIKIPAGGVLQFEIPNGDPQHPDYSPTLTGVILFSHDGLCEVESYTAAPAAADDSFCIGATVNGDTQPLPA